MAQRTSPRDDRRDAGFTMMEIVVAMAVFSVTVTIVLAIIINTAGVLRSNTQRVAAANLATKQIEATRGQRALDVPDGVTTRLETVGATDYTITQDADYVVAGASTSTCLSTGDQLAYKLVTVTVEWAGMAPVRPVRSDTLLALGIGDDDLDPTRGALAIGVTDAADQPLAGVVVSLTPGGASRTTGIDGCVVFADLAAGTYTASVNRSGHVGTANTQLAAAGTTVSAGRVARARLRYDRERQLGLTLVAPAGHTLPAGLPVSFRSSYVDAGAVLPSCSGVADRGCLSASPLTAQHLFPAVYELWAGSCSDARSAGASVDTTPAAASTSAQVPLAGVSVRVQEKNGGYQSGRLVTATHTSESVGGCSTGETYTLPASSSTGYSLGALPFGTWTISTALAPSVQVTLRPSQAVTPVALRRTS